MVGGRNLCVNCNTESCCSVLWTFFRVGPNLFRFFPVRHIRGPPRPGFKLLAFVVGLGFLRYGARVFREGVSITGFHYPLVVLIDRYPKN